MFNVSRGGADVRAKAWWSPFAYLSRRLKSLIYGLIARVPTTAEMRILDYGADDSPYRDAFPRTAEYLAADLHGNPRVQVELRADGSIPQPDASFDVVLSTQVLEHVPDPVAYLAECLRVLKPGGSLVLSTHGIMYYHRDPSDYWRWTCDGLAKLMTDHGFEVREMRGVLGLAAAALQLFQHATYYYLPRVLRAPYALAMQGLIALADRFYSEERRLQNGLVLGVVAVKPGHS